VNVFFISFAQKETFGEATRQQAIEEVWSVHTLSAQFLAKGTQRNVWWKSHAEFASQCRETVSSMQ
jgi:hypothetical protein